MTKGTQRAATRLLRCSPPCWAHLPCAGMVEAWLVAEGIGRDRKTLVMVRAGHEYDMRLVSREEVFPSLPI